MMQRVTEPGLTVGAVARRLGVAPATLRTWERRYGLGPSGRVAGTRRRYTPADVDRLDRMRRLCLEGVAPQDAARAVLDATDGATAGQARVVGQARGPVGLPTQLGKLLETDDRAGRPGGPGGRVLAVPDGEARARGLARAAMALDEAGARDLLLATTREAGVLATWERLLVPVLTAVGDRWAATGEGVEVEHLLVAAAQFALSMAVAEAPEPVATRPALLACAEDEGHCLPLYALCAGLAERGVPAKVLGASLPAESLVAAVRRCGPAAVFVWSQVPETGGAAFVDDIPVTRPPTAVVVGGPGWDPAALPARATLAYDLGDAVHLVQVAAGVG